MTPPLVWEPGGGVVPHDRCSSPLRVHAIALHPVADAELRLCQAPISGEGRSWMVVYRGPAGWHISVGPRWWAEEAAWEAALMVLTRAVGVAFSPLADDAERLACRRLLDRLGAGFGLSETDGAGEAAAVVAGQIVPEGSPFVTALGGGETLAAGSIDRPALRRVVMSAFEAGVLWSNQRPAAAQTA